ncbi:MAG: DUF615 domain-containing protein [Burkholderiales bacterium]|nr:DUF615 domain-containing protein [Burkholderiales bacterium]
MRKSNPNKPENKLENDAGYDDSRPSKSLVKRQMTALQKTGQALADMPMDRLKRSPAGPALLEAIREYQRTRSHEGRRRQLQYIGKVMRNEDGELLEKWIAGETLDQRLDVTRMHAAEQWRDKLIEQPTLLAEFIRAYPVALDTDLHTLIRNARNEKEKNKPPKSARELFKLIKSWVSVPGDPAAPVEGEEEDGLDEGTQE